MGLEMVEIVMHVEEAYGIEISNEEAAQSPTFGQFVDTVHLRLGSVENLSPKERALKRLRLLLSSEFGVAPENLTPETNLDTLNPGLPEDVFWNRLIRCLGREAETVSRTTLYAPKGFLKAVIATYVGLLLVHTFFLIDKLGFAGTILISLILSFAELFFFFRLIRPLRRVVILYKTIADLIPLVGSNRDTGIPREQLAREMRGIIANQLGLREDQIHEHSHFVKDLGCG